MSGVGAVGGRERFGVVHPAVIPNRGPCSDPPRRAVVVTDGVGSVDRVTRVGCRWEAGVISRVEPALLTRCETSRWDEGWLRAHHPVVLLSFSVCFLCFLKMGVRLDEAVSPRVCRQHRSVRAGQSLLTRSLTARPRYKHI